MQICLIRALCCLAGLAALDAASLEPARKLTSVVRADTRSGRLVRALKVSGGPSKGADGRPVSGRQTADAILELRDSSLEKVIEEASRRHKVDAALIHSVIQVESNYDPLAISPKGAQGLMQLMPFTARRFEVRNSFDPGENIEGGVRYLKHLLGLYNHDRGLALAAYNAGEAAVAKYGGIPPYRETMQYVHKVNSRLARAAEKNGAPSDPIDQTVAQNPKIEQYIDGEGRLHLWTRSSP